VNLTTPPLEVFISYAREDREAASRLYNDLRKAGVKPWMDTEDLLPGEDWRLGIRRAVENSTYFLALLSNKSLAKRGYVQKELRLAYAVLDELPPEHIFLIPVRLEPCEPIDERIKDKNWLDLFPSYDSALKKLLRGIAPNLVADAAPTVVDQSHCPHCGQHIPLTAQRCPGCACQVAPANVRRAAAEALDLDARYALAIEDSQSRGIGERILEFETAIRDSRPVLSMHVDGLFKLIQDDAILYATYYQLADSRVSLPSRETANVRAVVDAVLFPGNGQDLRFAALSLGDRGIRRYGPVWVGLKDKYISHRTTVTESSSFKMVSGQLLTEEFPRGYISTWDDRHKLAVAKLAHTITADTDAHDFEHLLLAQGENDDEFMEVQIAGPFNKRAFRSVAVHSGEFNGRSRTMMHVLQDLCKRNGIEFRVI
jgi:hypothetical protein